MHPGILFFYFLTSLFSVSAKTKINHYKDKGSTLAAETSPAQHQHT